MNYNQLIIIAEAGINHNGNISVAKKLINLASKAGAHYIKFQTFSSENLTTQRAQKANYQIANTKKKKETQFQMLKKLELSYKNHINLKKYCKKKKIKFLSTPFDNKSFDLLKKIGLNIFKLSSSDLNNIPYLQYISRKSNNKTKIILSTGMSSINEINEAIKNLTKFNICKKNICLLHCTSNYPASDKSLNLNALKTLKKKFKLKIGYSDHSKGGVASLVAVGLGISIIEKHFTLDKKASGPDHKASLSPKELISFVSDLMRAQKMLGDGLKKIQSEEINVKKVARKSVVANKKILKGEKFTFENLTTKRPGTGLEPKKIFSLVGKVAKKNFNTDQLIS